MKLYDTKGNEYIISIFLIVLGNSRYKYIELTFDQTQPTLFRCLSNSFRYFGGTIQQTETITIPSNYLKIVFMIDSSGNSYYGFRAVITLNYD